MASNYLVTLQRCRGSLLEAAGAPPEALDPLIRGVVDTHFELTGPIARGNWETVERHLAVSAPSARTSRSSISCSPLRPPAIAGRDPAEVPA